MKHKLQIEVDYYYYYYESKDYSDTLH